MEDSGAEKKNLRAALGRSRRNPKTGFNYLVGQKAAKTEPEEGPKSTPEATRAEEGDIATKI